MDRASTTWADIFEPRPEQWGLRGDPVLWGLLRERLEARLPLEDAAAPDELVDDTFRELTGIAVDDLNYANTPEHLYKPEWEAGGMSSGSIHLPTWGRRLLPLLRERLQARLDR